MYMTVVSPTPLAAPRFMHTGGSRKEPNRKRSTLSCPTTLVPLRPYSGFDFDRHHKMDINITNLTLDNGNFGMDQNDPNAIDYKTCEKGMAGIWTSAPNVKISGIVLLGFVCTYKILTPDARVIDFNEEISLRASKDVILVGDVL